MENYQHCRWEIKLAVSLSTKIVLFLGLDNSKTWVTYSFKILRKKSYETVISLLYLTNLWSVEEFLRRLCNLSATLVFFLNFSNIIIPPDRDHNVVDIWHSIGLKYILKSNAWPIWMKEKMHVSRISNSMFLWLS